jgi:hypothetical protein
MQSLHRICSNYFSDLGKIGWGQDLPIFSDMQPISILHLLSNRGHQNSKLLAKKKGKSMRKDSPSWVEIRF